MGLVLSWPNWWHLCACEPVPMHGGRWFWDCTRCSLHKDAGSTRAKGARK